MKHIKEKKRINRLIHAGITLSVFFMILSIEFLTSRELWVIPAFKYDRISNTFMNIALVMVISDIIGILLINMLFKKDRLAFKERWYKLKLIRKKKHLRTWINPGKKGSYTLTFSFLFKDEMDQVHTFYGDINAYTYLKENTTSLIHARGDQILEVKVLKNKNENIM